MGENLTGWLPKWGGCNCINSASICTPLRHCISSGFLLFVPSKMESVCRRRLDNVHLKTTAIVQHESLSRINVAVWLVFVRPSLPSVNNLRLNSATVHYVTNQVLCLSLVFLCVSVICKSNQLVLTNSVLMNRLIACAIVFSFLVTFALII